MLTIAFWNIHGQALLDEVVDLADDLARPAPTEIVLALAEPTAVDGNVLAARIGWPTVIHHPRLTILSNIPHGYFGETKAHLRQFITTLARPTGKKINLCFTHGASPFAAWNPSSVASNQAQTIRTNIETFERTFSTPDTVIVGDLNMDPYCPSMVDLFGLNAAMCRLVAKNQHRYYLGDDGRESIRMFYNPTWQLLGDRSSANQPGSYYNSGDRTDATYWHAIDQALVRPGLVEAIVPGTPRYITKAGARALFKILKEETDVLGPAQSDHLPIMIQLDI